MKVKLSVIRDILKIILKTEQQKLDRNTAYEEISKIMGDKVTFRYVEFLKLEEEVNDEMSNL